MTLSKNLNERADDEIEDQAMADHEIFRELAELSLVAYDRIRKDKAEELGIRASVLDRVVKEIRNELLTRQSEDELTCSDEPWGDPVEGIDLYREIIRLLRRHVILPKGAEVAITLWIFGTYAYDAFRIWPRLLLSSPEKRCGKSTLLETIKALSHQALLSSSISPSGIFRCIDAWKPTLLIDEADCFIHGNDELRGIINSGHTRSSAYVIRVVGDDHEPRKFSTWAPMVLAMIKLPPDTIIDRSIKIEMRRKLPGESVKKLPLDFPFECRHLRSKLLRWSMDNIDALKYASPTLPHCGNDRAIDNWTPLMAISDTIGEGVTEEAKTSFHAIQATDEDADTGPMILADIRYIFDGRGKQYLKLTTKEIIDALVAMDERPWCEASKGKPINSHRLASMLKHFRIESKDMRFGDKTLKGYERECFDDAFRRYLPQDPPFQSATPQHSRNGAGFSRFQSATLSADVADEITL